MKNFEEKNSYQVSSSHHSADARHTAVTLNDLVGYDLETYRNSTIESGHDLQSVLHCIFMPTCSAVLVDYFHSRLLVDY
jgi:hypothetical protein